MSSSRATACNYADSANFVTPALAGPTALEPSDAAGADFVQQPGELPLRGNGEHFKRLFVGLAYRPVKLASSFKPIGVIRQST